MNLSPNTPNLKVTEMGPSFLELVAQDIARGHYRPGEDRGVPLSNPTMVRVYRLGSRF